ncbi:MAG: tRNA pseudouridine(55) synthase TruB [Capsulimonadaceae bacterium]
MNGILNIDKPAGMTSHDVVARVRRIAHEKRVGHAGTLDPDATGVLVVALGSATRIVDLVTEAGKRYWCTLALGIETDTEDSSGTVIGIVNAERVSHMAVEKVLSDFVGDILQVPPMVSAVHHEGKRLYELAREGVTVDRPARPVRIDSIDLLDFAPGRVARAVLEVACGKGTYIRTLCADIGRALGTGGHMESLRRTAVGAFDIESAVPLDALTPANIASHLMRAVDALSSMPIVTAGGTDAADLSHGRAIPAALDEAFDGQVVAIVDGGGELLALAHPDAGLLRPFKVFAG